MPETTVRGDLEWGTTPRLVRSAAERFGDAAAIEDGEITLGFSGLAAAADAAARAFMASGVERGDRVAIWAPNVWEWVVAALGLQAAGAALVPLNTRYKAREAAYILARSGARTLVTVNGFLGNDYVTMLRGATDVARELPALRDIIVLRGEAPLGCVGWYRFLARAADVSREASAARALEVKPGDLSDVLFTSGTTGHPKGVMCTHGQTLRAFRDWSEVIGLSAGDRYLVVNPFFHAFGYKAGWLSALMMGATTLPHPVFDAGQVLERIPRDRVTMLPGPPALFQAILAHPALETHDVSSLRLGVTGAAVIPVQLIVDMRERLGFDTVITGYGLTEASGVATMCRAGDDPETIASTSGRAIPETEVRVVDDAGAEVPRGEAGEVVVRGYNVMQGYLDDPEATAAAVDQEGWLRTGDIGVMNAAGYLRITDRKKDMFIVGGFNAYPAEIETLMLAHPDVAEVAVVGVPDDRLGEIGVAFVVRRGELDEEGLVGWCREEMANFKVPRRVVWVDALPRNALGKVTKFVLRERVAQEAS